MSVAAEALAVASAVAELVRLVLSSPDPHRAAKRAAAAVISENASDALLRTRLK